ncbi:hypothetical protein J3F83DRAFT_713846 [Trichoderma novae-zelandiae]
MATYSTDPALYIYTSLTAGSSHIVTATSRLETILRANRVPFKAIDISTDDKARMLWGRRAGKDENGRPRKFPALVQEGIVLGDIVEIEEWNEYGELKQHVKIYYDETTIPDVNHKYPEPVKKKKTVKKSAAAAAAAAAEVSAAAAAPPPPPPGPAPEPKVGSSTASIASTSTPRASIDTVRSVMSVADEAAQKAKELRLNALRKKVHGDKKEEPKEEATKAEETKAEETKVEEPKSEEIKEPEAEKKEEGEKENKDDKEEVVKEDEEAADDAKKDDVLNEKAAEEGSEHKPDSKEAEDESHDKQGETEHEEHEELEEVKEEDEEDSSNDHSNDDDTTDDATDEKAEANKGDETEKAEQIEEGEAVTTSQPTPEPSPDATAKSGEKGEKEKDKKGKAPRRGSGQVEACAQNVNPRFGCQKACLVSNLGQEARRLLNHLLVYHTKTFRDSAPLDEKGFVLYSVRIHHILLLLGSKIYFNYESFFHREIYVHNKNTINSKIHINNKNAFRGQIYFNNKNAFHGQIYFNHKNAFHGQIYFNNKGPVNSEINFHNKNPVSSEVNVNHKNPLGSKVHVHNKNTFRRKNLIGSSEDAFVGSPILVNYEKGFFVRDSSASLAFVDTEAYYHLFFFNAVFVYDKETRCFIYFDIILVCQEAFWLCYVARLKAERAD